MDKVSGRDKWELPEEDIRRIGTIHKQPKYLWVFSAANRHVVDWHHRLIQSRISDGYDVAGICNTFEDDGYQWYPFYKLDELWKKRDQRLMALYDRIAAAMQDRDILILYNGANLHPDFVRQLPGLKVYTYGDPESWDHLAGPMASAFDIHFANQFSEVGKLGKLGLKHVFFCPLGTRLLSGEISSNEEDVLRPRSIPLAMFCGRTKWRNERMDALVSAFPDAFIRGEGWPGGRISYDGMHEVYQKTGIGWNMHNTTGFCFRTYDLAAYGAMQLCDCMEDLPHIFNMSSGQEEVIGYASVAECIDKTRYYLSHVDEQREIALRAWKRCKDTFTPNAVWDYMTRRIMLVCMDHALSIGVDESGSGRVIRREKLPERTLSLTGKLNGIFRRLFQ